MVGEIIIEHDEDEDDDRHLIDMALQLSQVKLTTEPNTELYKLSIQ